MFYFVPTDKSLITLRDLPELGLSHAFDGQGPACAVIHDGPGNQVGVMAGTSGQRLGYDSARQTWKKGPGGKWWFGYANDQRPGPEMLARPTAIAGTAVKLRDGKLWTIPRVLALLPGRPSTLPQLLDLDEDGRTWVGSITPEYRDLHARTWKYWQGLTGQVGPEESAGWYIDLAILALAVNYRVGPVEVAALGLLSDEEVRAILRAIVDADEVVAAAKKNSAPRMKADGPASAP